MTAFRYKALTAEGKKISGTVDAQSPREATRALRADGLHVTSIEEASGGISAGLKRMSGRRSDEAWLFTSHMRRLVRAKLPLVEALDATASQLAGQPMGAVVTRIRDKVAGGASLGEAIADEKDYFDELYVAMIHAAQASGNMAAAFDSIHQYEGARREFRRRLTSAMAYPAVLVMVAFLAIMFLMTLVVPQIARTLISAKVALPLVTEVLISLSAVARSYWYVVIAVLFLLAFSPRILGAWGAGRAFLDRTLIFMPLTKRFVRPATVARFSRTFSALLATGLRVADALEVAGNVSGNCVFAEAVSQARLRIMSGGDLAGALGESGLLPAYAIQVVGVGERTGTLADSFAEIARAEEEDLQTATDRFMTFLEPAIIVVMAGVVGFIVASVLLPILSMSTMAT